jgi:outer membrane immunogenic protein
MMRSIITIACGLTALATSAMAADLPVKAPPPPPAPVTTWTGCYIGGNLGWARAETRLTFNNFGDDFRRSADGFAGGGQVGCDYQFNSNWVIGVQGLFDGTDIKVDRVSRLFPADTLTAKVDWFGTVTARFGYAFTQSFLLYGKVGWGTYESSLTVANTLTGVELGSASRRRSGLDAGVGAEWMVMSNWSLWVEWDHISPRDQAVFFNALATGAEIRRDFDKVLVGLNWRFGGGGPVRASY